MQLRIYPLALLLSAVMLAGSLVSPVVASAPTASKKFVITKIKRAERRTVVRLGARLAERDAKIAAQEETITRLSGNVNDLYGRLSELNRRVCDLEGEEVCKAER